MAEEVRQHRYHIEYNRRELEIVCPRYIFADGVHIVVIPWFLLPGRPYPVQVYLYACSLYSANPGIGQRGAAKATREKFKLETFSHSTVSRSFKAFERAREFALGSRFGGDLKVCGKDAPKLVGPAAKHVGNNGEDAPNTARRIPSASCTAARCKEMAGFFREYYCAAESGGIKAIEAAGRRFSRKWHEKTHRLLI